MNVRSGRPDEVIRVLLADDQPLIRAGFRALLESEDDMEVVGEAGDGAAAVELAGRLRPDVALLDITMPGMNGLEATRLITADQRMRGVRVVILTNYDLDQNLYTALRDGASGFLVKDTQPGELLHALRVVADGEALLSPRVTRRLIATFAATPTKPVSTSTLSALTQREREVLTLIAHGLSNVEIAEHMVIGLATVKSHVSRTLTKLSARDRAQLVMHAYESGLVAPGIPQPGVNP